MPNNSATNSDSLSDTNVDNPSHEGKSAQSKSTEQLLAEHKEENKRKAQEILDLRSKLDAVQSNLEARMDELQNKSRISLSEEQELETIQEQVNAIKRDRRSAPWLTIHKEIAETEAEKSAIAHTQKLADDLAYLEIEKFAKAEGKTVDEIEKDIVRYMRLVDPAGDMTAVRRAHEAYNRMKQDQEYQMRLDELKKKEEQFSESGGRRINTQQSDTLKSEIDRASKSGDFSNVIAKVYEKHAVRP